MLPLPLPPLLPPPLLLLLPLLPPLLSPHNTRHQLSIFCAGQAQHLATLCLGSCRGAVRVPTPPGVSQLGCPGCPTARSAYCGQTMVLSVLRKALAVRPGVVLRLREDLCNALSACAMRRPGATRSALLAPPPPIDGLPPLSLPVSLLGLVQVHPGRRQAITDTWEHLQGVHLADGAVGQRTGRFVLH